MTDRAASQLKRPLEAGQRHSQLAGDGPEANSLRLEFLHFGGAAIDRGSPAKLNATGLGSSQRLPYSDQG